MAKNLISQSRIPLIFRIYFLYFDPTAALMGAYLCFSDPAQYIKGTVPLPFITANPSSLDISPLMQMMLTNIGSLYILFAIQQGVVLRLTREKAVWVAVMLSMVATDCGHLYAAYAIAPERMGQVTRWSAPEWVNYGTLMGGMALRVLFLLGIGNY